MLADMTVNLRLKQVCFIKFFIVPTQKCHKKHLSKNTSIKVSLLLKRENPRVFFLLPVPTSIINAKVYEDICKYDAYSSITPPG